MQSLGWCDVFRTRPAACWYSSEASSYKTVAISMFKKQGIAWLVVTTPGKKILLDGSMNAYLLIALGESDDEG